MCCLRSTCISLFPDNSECLISRLTYNNSSGVFVRVSLSNFYVVMILTVVKSVTALIVMLTMFGENKLPCGITTAVFTRSEISLRLKLVSKENFLMQFALIKHGDCRKKYTMKTL